MKLCRDCLYYRQYESCVKQPNPVTGEPQFGWRGSCDHQREDYWFSRLLNNSCGKIGRFWKAKEASVPKAK